MKFPPISWIIAGSVLSGVAVFLPYPQNVSFAIIGFLSLMWGALKGIKS